jgi:hypothetical protein
MAYLSSKPQTHITQSYPKPEVKSLEATSPITTNSVKVVETAVDLVEDVLVEDFVVDLVLDVYSHFVSQY